MAERAGEGGQGRRAEARWVDRAMQGARQGEEAEERCRSNLRGGALKLLNVWVACLVSCFTLFCPKTFVFETLTVYYSVLSLS